jgi:hypothetical protein
MTEAGTAAEAAYRATIVESRAKSGRASFDDAREGWRQRYGVQADDGIVLGEIVAGAHTSAALVTALEVCGKNREAVLAALERLAEAGLIVES